MSTKKTELADAIGNILHQYNSIAENMPPLVFNQTDGTEITADCNPAGVAYLCEVFPIMDAPIAELLADNKDIGGGNVVTELARLSASAQRQETKDYLRDLALTAQGIYEDQKRALVQDFVMSVPLEDIPAACEMLRSRAADVPLPEGQDFANMVHDMAGHAQALYDRIYTPGKSYVPAPKNHH